MSGRSSQILFICTGNYYRSRYAEGLFNFEAEKRGLPWRSISRGLAIHLAKGDLSPLTRKEFEKKKIPVTCTGETRVALSVHDLAQSQRTIGLQHHEHYPLMQKYFPDWADEIEYWDVADAEFLSPMLALRRIEQLTMELVETLSGSAEETK